MTSSTVYAAAVFDLANRIELARFDHREGYTLTGRVSPDGSRVAVLVVPPDAGESAARQDGGEIWMVPAAGGEPQLFNSRVGYILNWSPDGQILAAGRYLPAGTTGTLTPNRNEIFLVDADTAAEQVIRTENGSSALLGLGWSPDAARYYTALGISTGGWSIEAWERAENYWSQVITLPQEKEAASISLSPAGDSLLLSEQSTSGQVVSIQPLDGSPAWVLLETGLTSGTTGVTAVWQADGSQLMMFSAAGASDPASVRRVSVASPQDAVVEDRLAAVLQSRPGLVPLGWSASGSWLVMRDYNEPALPLYLLARDGGEARLVAPGTQGGFLTFLGWLGI